MTWSWRVLRAGAFKLDGGAMFGMIPRVVWEKAVPPDDRHRIPLDTNCLLLEGHGLRVLIETGIGDKQGPKQRELYAMAPRSIADALREVAVDPGSIDAVVLSHLHFDHAGGMSTLDPSGAPRLLFPRAEVYTQKQEWEDALANRSTMHSTYLRDHLDPMAPRVRAVDGAARLDSVKGASVRIPDVWVEPMPGHTFGQQAVFFRDDEARTVVFPGDLMPTAHHAGLAYNMAYDVLPYENMQRKRAFLEHAEADGWLIALDHEPGFPIARAERGEKPGSWRLAPADDERRRVVESPAP